MKLIIMIYLLFFITVPAITSLLVRKIPGFIQVEDSQTIYFHNEKPYQGNFTSPKDKLVSISIKMKNAFSNTDPLVFNLYENETQIRELKMNGSNIVDGAWTRFAFPEVSESKNKNYSYILYSETKDINQSLGIYTTAKNIPALMTYHRADSYPSTIIQIYNNFGQRLIQDKIFLMVWGVLIVTCFYLLRKTSTSSFS